MEAILWSFFLISLTAWKIQREYKEFKKPERFKKEIDSIFDSRKELQNSQRFYSDDCISAVCLSEAEDKICFIFKTDRGDLNDLSFVDCKDLISASIVIDGKTSTKTEGTGAALGGAVAGGLLFGGAGAVVGAIAANETTSEEIKNIEKVDLVVTVNHTQRPIIYLRFFDKSSHQWLRKSKSNKDSPILERKLEEVSHWNGVFTALISRNSSQKKIEYETKLDGEKTVENFSTSDEINKLVKLKNFKAITPEEFDTLKGRLIAQSKNEYKSVTSEILKIAVLKKNKNISEDDFVKLKQKIINS